MISTRDLSLLPDVDLLRQILQSDAILSPERLYQYYSFNAHWQTGEQMGSMRNENGDHCFAHFDPAGWWIKGFAHEYPMTHTARPLLASGRASSMRSPPGSPAVCRRRRSA